MERKKVQALQWICGEGKREASLKPEKARGTPQGFLESLEFCKKPWKSERGYGINKIVIVRKQLQGKTLVIGGIMPDQYFERWNLMQQTIPAKEVKTV